MNQDLTPGTKVRLKAYSLDVAFDLCMCQLEDHPSRKMVGEVVEVVDVDGHIIEFKHDSDVGMLGVIWPLSALERVEEEQEPPQPVGASDHFQARTGHVESPPGEMAESEKPDDLRVGDGDTKQSLTPEPEPNPDLAFWTAHTKKSLAALDTQDPVTGGPRMKPIVKHEFDTKTREDWEGESDRHYASEMYDRAKNSIAADQKFIADFERRYGKPDGGAK